MVINYITTPKWKIGEQFTVAEMVDGILAHSSTLDPRRTYMFIGWLQAHCSKVKNAMNVFEGLTAWLESMQSVSNPVRNMLRDALVSYILQYKKPSSEIVNPEKLYEYFLIDVEMDACMNTSRIRQALSTVQLFIQRCLMNLEPKDFDAGKRRPLLISYMWTALCLCSAQRDLEERGKYLMNNVRPHLTMLTEEQVQDIHRYTLQILATTGVRVDSPSALEMLRKRLGSSRVQDRTVRIPAELVEWAIRAAPRRIQVHDRRGEPQFHIGGEEDRTRFGIGVTALYYLEPETDTPVLFQRRHMQDMVRLGNKLPHYDMVSTVGIVRDVPEHLTDLYGRLEHFANGIKPLVLLCSDEHRFEDVMQMFDLLHGSDLGEKPFILPYFSLFNGLCV